MKAYRIVIALVALAAAVVVAVFIEDDGPQKPQQTQGAPAQPQKPALSQEEQQLKNMRIP